MIETGTEDHPGFAKYLDGLPEASTWTEKKTTAAVSAAEIVKGLDFNRYWSYQGSFTTPPCTEGVDWFVLCDTIKLSAAQIAKIESASGFNNNFRPPQPLNGRSVFTGGAEPYNQWNTKANTGGSPVTPCEEKHWPEFAGTWIMA